MARTFKHLLTLYLESPEYKALAPLSKYTYRKTMDRLLLDENIGHRPVATMRREHVKLIVGRNAQSPGRANDFLMKLRILIRFAIDIEWRETDPTLRIKGYENQPFHTWTEEEIAQFEEAFPVGTTTRRCFAVLLYTGQRVGDCAKMDWSDVKNGVISVVQEKTDQAVDLPMHPMLRSVIGTEGRGPILTSQYGRGFSARSLSQHIGDSIRSAGLPERCVGHGLRKAAARRLAEAGCTPHQIMAITGHQSLKEVERYTAAFARKAAARSAIEKLALNY